MPATTTIRELTVEDLDLALTKPFGIATGAQAAAANLLVTVELTDGTRGYGEAAPLPVYNGETRDGTRAAIQSVRDLVLGANARQWRGIALKLKSALPRSGAARCALETAVLDAFTRRDRVSMVRYLGSAKRVLHTDYTITTGTADDAARTARDVAACGFRALKIKVGGSNLAQDVERVTAVRGAAPSATILLDANAAFTADEALQLLAGLRERSIAPALFEQPVGRDDYEGLARVRREGKVALAADESATSPDDVRKLIAARAVQVINIKLMKCGLLDAMEMAWIAREAGLKLMIGGMVESILAMTTSACFAAGSGGFSFIDLDTPLLLAANPFDGGMVYDGDTIRLAQIKAGHGVAPRSAARA